MGRYLTSLYYGWQLRGQFQHVRTFCLFLGYPRSGHTLIGSLLDAHPNAVFAQELDVLKFAQRGFSPQQIFAEITSNSRAFARAGRTWAGYSYAVPTQWQGRHADVHVIGDRDGSGAAKRLRVRRDLLDRLRLTMGTVQVRCVHVVRNAFDNIAAISVRSSVPLATSIDRYFSLCQTVSQVLAGISPSAYLNVFHEEFIADPQTQLARICRFLKLDPLPEYLGDCAKIVFSSPHKSRSMVEWTPDRIADVARRMERFPWLANYRFDS